jgi:hypothetical protein
MTSGGNELVSKKSKGKRMNFTFHVSFSPHPHIIFLQIHAASSTLKFFFSMYLIENFHFWTFQKAASSLYLEPLITLGLYNEKSARIWTSTPSHVHNHSKCDRTLDSASTRHVWISTPALRFARPHRARTAWPLLVPPPLPSLGHLRSLGDAPATQVGPQ